MYASAPFWDCLSPRPATRLQPPWDVRHQAVRLQLPCSRGRCSLKGRLTSPPPSPFFQLYLDVQDEVVKVGHVAGIAIPIPPPHLADSDPCRVYVKYTSGDEAKRCKVCVVGGGAFLCKVFSRPSRGAPLCEWVGARAGRRGGAADVGQELPQVGRTSSRVAPCSLASSAWLQQRSWRRVARRAGAGAPPLRSRGGAAGPSPAPSPCAVAPRSPAGTRAGPAPCRRRPRRR
jgi:hypothetical protein